MINFRRMNKRSMRRERDDALSIVTGGRSVIHVGGVNKSFREHKRVRHHDAQLKKDFANARANVYYTRGEQAPAGCSFVYPSSQLKCTLKSPHFCKENDPISSVIFPIPSPVIPPQSPQNQRPRNGSCTLGCLPPLVNSSQCRQAALSSQKPRGILKPTNQIQGIHADSQVHYWSLYGNTNGRVQKAKLATATVHSMDTKRSGNKASSWKICSSMPMNRQDANLVQMQMVSTMCSESSASSISSSSYVSSPFFSPTQGDEAMQNQHQMNPVDPSRYAIPSLLKSVIPPTSPFFRTTQDTPRRPASYGPCGVHQSEWIDRSKCVGRAPTKQYSMEQIIDILCGFATPDSIMADQLFQPLQSAQMETLTGFPEPAAAPSTSTYFIKQSETSSYSNNCPNQSNLFDSNVFPNTARRSNKQICCDDEETSIYFKSAPKKKSVSFLTDSQDNISVAEYFFDPYSQQNSGFSGRNSCMDNENIDPNIFENVVPPAPTDVLFYI